MRGFKKRFLALLLTIVMVLSIGSVAFATQPPANSSNTSLNAMWTEIIDGEYLCKTTKKNIDYTTKKYKITGGGYHIFSDMLDGSQIGKGDVIKTTTLEELTAKGRRDFVTDLLTLANAMAYDSANGFAYGSDAVTDETVEILYNDLSQISGLGSTLLASLLQNTKPDYIAANRIYQPFSGVVGTILGVVSVLIMALLGVTMALDLAYITIPAVQMALGGDENVNQKGEGKNGKGLSGLISVEAKKACEAASGGSGGQAGQGEYKAAVGIYFKYRWKGLTILVICLLYLVQGEIYTFISWFIDLFTGFLGG